jgi:signal transduction histidine kinase
MRWSIRTKIMLVLTALLLFVVGAYLFLAERVFREDKELLVFDTNRASTQQLASEIEVTLRRLSDKLEILAQLSANPASESRILASSFFEEDPDLLLFQLMRGRKNPQVLRELVSTSKLKALKLTPAQIHDVRVLGPSTIPLPRGKTANEGVLIENRSIGDSVLYLVKIPVRFKAVAGQSDSEPAFVQAVFDGKPWLERFRQNQGLAFSFAVTANGTVLAYPRLQPVLERRDLRVLDPVQQAMNQDFAIQQLEFSMEGKKYLGLYQKTSIGSVIVVSMTDKAAALAARGLLVEKTLYLSLFIFTIVLLISLYFASSLSTPLLRLVQATREIAHGNFDTEIQADTGDEIGVLAQSFSQMGRDLKSSRLLLEKSNSELEHKVLERTQELESKNADIKKQQEVLLRTTRLAAVGEIAGQAAHEVLNPLTAMISRLEAVAQRVQGFSALDSAPLPVLHTILKGWQEDYLEGGLPKLASALEKPSLVHSGKNMMDEDLGNLNWVASQFEALGTQLGLDLDLLLRESHRIARIVDGMRGLSRASKIRTRIDLISLIGESVRVSEDLLARHRTRIETRFEEAPVYVHVDTDEMRQVFSNLIKNSMDAIDTVIEKRKQGLISIHTFTQEDHIRIRIRDNGAGIKTEDQQQLFQSDFSTKGVQGTGLGLGICRRFVREASGELNLVASVPGEYTEFEITLPLSNEITEAMS